MNYLNILGEAKSHGHCKAHVLAELVKTDQLEPSDRKSFLKKYIRSGMNLAIFCEELGVRLSRLNWMWASKFHGGQKDKYTCLLDEDEMEEYKRLWNSKNKRKLYHFHEVNE